MTSEELNRTIEFIIQHQARAAVLVEDLVRTQKRDREWAKRMLAGLNADIQNHAERMAWWEAFVREEREWRHAFEETMQKRHEEDLARLDRILDKLSDRTN